jgi:hypothetical protein
MDTLISEYETKLNTTVSGKEEEEANSIFTSN